MTLQIEEGKYYRTRDGRKVGPLKNEGWTDGQPWTTSRDMSYWSSDGGYNFNREISDMDLVAEWVDEPTPMDFCASGVLTKVFKPGDLVTHVRVKAAGIGTVQEVDDKGRVVVKYRSDYGLCIDAPEDLQLYAQGDEPVAEQDLINHPPHYTGHASGVECIQITEHMNFCRGNAMKYLWRAGEKGREVEDLKKARWYIDREISRLEKIVS